MIIPYMEGIMSAEEAYMRSGDLTSQLNAALSSLIGPSIYGIIIGHSSRPPTRFVSSLV